ncbi:MAG: exodeoxyribonuclease V subunit gamma [Thermomonas sp.]|uniref:exodeoxyribonuclease V subunit gamma n=1 Tax=Thermomonas sp. TaxID=1971895 RepID=UPI0039E36B34
MTAAAPDFRLYHSNALEVLAGVLSAQLNTPPPDGDWMRPDIVLVPQFAMRRWLQQFLASHAGICANLRFLTPGEFVDVALAANLGPASQADRLSPEVSRWHLLRALHDAPPHAYAHFLADADPLRTWALACGLADSFEKYQAWRRDLLLRWEAGAEPDDAQAQLWRTIARDRAHRARRIGDYLLRFGTNAAQTPTGLPPRLFVFACQNMSPDVLQVIASQSRAGEQHFFLHAPSSGFWNEAFSAGLGDWRARYTPADDDAVLDAGSNPLLAAWGRAERDFVAALAGGEAVHARIEVPAFAQPRRTHLLGRMQADVLANLDPARSQKDDTHWPRKQVERGDASLRFHACHTRLREVQVLHDQLRALLEADPELNARDIAVLAPDIDQYAPHVEAVFGGALRSARELPYTIADTSPLASASLAAAFVRLLDLPARPLALAELLDLLAVPALAQRFDADDAVRSRLRTWLAQAGARWGLDADERTHHHGEGDAYTFAFAVDRLLLGYASGDEDDIAGIAPLPTLEGSATDALDALLRLLAVLRGAGRDMREDKSPQAWARLLDGLLLALCGDEPRDPGDRATLQRLRNAIAAFATGATIAGFDAPVAHAVVRAELLSVLTQPDARAPFLSGGICFGRMVPMRLIPFRVICLLGMDDGAFPARDPRDPLNRIAQSLDTTDREVGDPSRRDADRYLFLQLFSSASHAFHVSWQGFDARDGSTREPASVVAELLDVAARYHADHDEARKALVVRHALQPFSPAAFGAAHADQTEGDPRRFSFDARWRAAADVTPGAMPLSVFAPQPLALLDAGEAALSLDHLRSALNKPQAYWLRHGLRLRLPEEDAATDDHEPLGPPDALLRHHLREQLFAVWLHDGARPSLDALHARLLARALAAPGADGRMALAQVLDEVTPFAETALQHGLGGTGGAQPYALDLGDAHLAGTLSGLHARGLFRAALRPKGLHGGHVLRHRLDALVAATQGIALLELHADSGEVTLIESPPADPAAARAALQALFALQRRMAVEPIPFLPKSAYAFVSAKDDTAGFKLAANEWRGGYSNAGERSAATALALRGREPFVDGGDDAEQRFAAFARAIFAALRDADASALEALS